MGTGRSFGLGGEMRMIGPMQGRVRAWGTWWDQEEQRIVIEGVDFSQDTQEGGADKFDSILDSNDERGISSVSTIDENEIVPEIEVQDEVLSGGEVVGDCGKDKVAEKERKEEKPSGKEMTGEDEGVPGDSQESKFELFKFDLVCILIAGFTQTLKRKRD